MKHFFCVLLVVVFHLSSVCYSSDFTVVEREGIKVLIPEKPLAYKSLQIAHVGSKGFLSWSDPDHAHSFGLLQKVASVWQQNKINQFLICGQVYMDSEMPFSWEIVPYCTQNTRMGSLWQILGVQWKIAFGAPIVPIEVRKAQREEYKPYFQDCSLFENINNTAIHGSDPFCKPEVIDKQLILDGNTVQVLYNYAPIGFGVEKLHFLVIPKKHRVDFKELQVQEYKEAMVLAKEIIYCFSKNRNNQEIFLVHKTGKDAGQTVFHWHMHIVISANYAHNLFYKLLILKNKMFGSTPMTDTELKERVEQLRAEFEQYQMRK